MTKIERTDKQSSISVINEKVARDQHQNKAKNIIVALWIVYFDSSAAIDNTKFSDRFYTHSHAATHLLLLLNKIITRYTSIQRLEQCEIFGC